MGLPKGWAGSFLTCTLLYSLRSLSMVLSTAGLSLPGLVYKDGLSLPELVYMLRCLLPGLVYRLGCLYLDLSIGGAVFTWTCL